MLRQNIVALLGTATLWFSVEAHAFDYDKHRLITFQALHAGKAAMTEGAPTKPVAAPAPRTEHPPSKRKDDYGDGLPEIEPRHFGSNYFAASVYDSDENSGMIKFQIDLEYDIIRAERWPEAGYFYLTVPIRILSYWDLFNTQEGSTSNPFIETNYQPGGEISWRVPTAWTRYASFRTGVFHESNGLGTTANGSDQERQSRSWNRVYLGATWQALQIKKFMIVLGGDVWVPFGSAEVAEWGNGESGGKMEDHAGYFEGLIQAELPFAKWFGFITTLRIREHSLNAELRYSLKNWNAEEDYQWLADGGNGFRLDFYSQCHFGRAERMIIANQSGVSCYVGLGL